MHVMTGIKEHITLEDQLIEDIEFSDGTGANVKADCQVDLVYSIDEYGDYYDTWVKVATVKPEGLRYPHEQEFLREFWKYHAVAIQEMVERDFETYVKWEG